MNLPVAYYGKSPNARSVKIVLRSREKSGKSQGIFFP